MIIRTGQARTKRRDEPGFGVMETMSFSDTAGITQYGAYLQTLTAGAKSSTRHWHERVVEDDGRHYFARVMPRAGRLVFRTPIMC